MYILTNEKQLEIFTGEGSEGEDGIWGVESMWSNSANRSILRKLSGGE